MKQSHRNRLFTITLLFAILMVALPTVYGQQDQNDDERVCDAFTGNSADVRIGYYMGEGVGYVESGRTLEAIDSYSCAIQIDSGYTPAYIGRAQTHVLRRDFDSALEDYNTIIAQEPSADAYNNRGIVYASLGDYEAASEDFNQAVSLDSSAVFAISNRGVLNAIQEDYPAAIADFEQAIEIDPDYAQAYALLGMTYSAQALDNYAVYIRLAGNRTDQRIQSAAGALESRFTFELRFDDGTWFLEAPFGADEE